MEPSEDVIRAWMNEDEEHPETTYLGGWYERCLKGTHWTEVLWSDGYVAEWRSLVEMARRLPIAESAIGGSVTFGLLPKDERGKKWRVSVKDGYFDLVARLNHVINAWRVAQPGLGPPDGTSTSGGVPCGSHGTGPRRGT